MKKKHSAGLLMYRIREGVPEVFLVHPGGPYFAKKDLGVWSVPKGEVDDKDDPDDLLAVAKREFEEETSFVPEGVFTYLTSVRRKDGKEVSVFVFEGDCEPSALSSNMISIPWPPKSGKTLEIPEVDRGAFFSLADAREKLYEYLVPMLDVFEERLIKENGKNNAHAT